MHDPYTTLVQLSTGHIVAARALSLQELIDGAKIGYAPYIGELRARIGDELELAIEPLVGDAAAEVVDDLFMALPRMLPGYREDGRFHAWMFGGAFNRARTRARADRRRPDTVDMPLGFEPSEPPTVEDRLAEEAILERAISVLSDSEREAWLLSYEGHDPREIAARLGIEPNAASVRVHRARKRLAEELVSFLDAR